jgi:hypothetical protein
VYLAKQHFSRIGEGDLKVLTLYFCGWSGVGIIPERIFDPFYDPCQALSRSGTPYFPNKHRCSTEDYQQFEVDGCQISSLKWMGAKSAGHSAACNGLIWTAYV